MPRYEVRAEFRRQDREARWVFAGVVVEADFWPAVEGVEMIRERLPMPGLDVARTHWPDPVRSVVPYASGTRDRS